MSSDTIIAVEVMNHHLHQQNALHSSCCCRCRLFGNPLRILKLSWTTIQPAAGDDIFSRECMQYMSPHARKTNFECTVKENVHV